MKRPVRSTRGKRWSSASTEHHVPHVVLASNRTRERSDALDAAHLGEELVRATSGCFLKDRRDLQEPEVELDAGYPAALISSSG